MLIDNKHIDIKAPRIEKGFTVQNILSVDLDHLPNYQRIVYSAFYRHLKDFNTSNSILFGTSDLIENSILSNYILLRNYIDLDDVYCADKIISNLEKSAGHTVKFSVAESLYQHWLKNRNFYNSKWEKICGNLRVIYINLNKQKSRKGTLLSRAYKLNLPMERFDAVYVDKTKIVNRFSSEFSQQRLNRMDFGALGCWLSHYEVWKLIASSNNELGAFVVEDDAWFRINFMAASNYFDPEKYDVIYINDRMENDIRLIDPGNFFISSLLETEKHRKNNFYYQPGKEGKGTDGYWISKNGAQKFLDALSDKKINIGLDPFFRISCKSGYIVSADSIIADVNLTSVRIRAGVLTPALVEHRDSYLNRIAASKKNQTPNPKQ